jgi:surface antigen
MSIIDGIEDYLGELGYRSTSFDYRRTASSLSGCIGEISEILGLSSLKAEELAIRVEFLTSEIPELNIVLAGESNGAAICEEARRLLEDNPQVFYIETGPSFWYPATSSEQALVITDNGIYPDTFSSGDFFTIIRVNLESLLGLSGNNSGKILGYIGAPGHAYTWEYEGVKSQISNFLHGNFDQDSGGL